MPSLTILSGLKVPNYAPGATGPKLIISWPYKNHSNEASTCQYYKYILGRIWSWSELVE